MAWDNVTITLHNDATESLYTGDIVTGIVTLDLIKDLKVDSIYMEITGISKGQWTRFTPTVPYLKIYTEKKKIFYVKQNMFFEELQVDKIMRAGIYCYPFHFTLPHNLPSTFQSSIASVRYYIKIKSKPRFKVNKYIPFNVLANVNLNNQDDMLKPYIFDFQRSFRNKTNVEVHLKTYKCFAPRQLIPMKATIKNEKQVKIKKICVALVQKLRYTVSSGYADDKINVYEVDFKNIKNTIMEICDLMMEIPQIAPSSINSTDPNMIDISYEIRVEVYFSYHFNLIESIPVTVAAVPVIHNDF